MGRFIVGVAGVLLLAVTGCTTTQPQPAPPTDRIPGVALTWAETAALAADYDNRNNAAIASTVKASSTSPWTLADTGPTLAADRFITDAAWNGGERLTPVRVTFLPKATWANRFSSYPIWAITRVGVQNEPAIAGADGDLLVVFRREAASAPWLVEMTLRVAGVPNAPDDGAGLTTSADVDAALTTMDQVVAFLDQGTRPDFYVTPDLGHLRGQFSVPQQDEVGATTVACRPFYGTSAPRDSLRVVRSSSGVLSVMSLLCLQTTTAKPGKTIARPAGYAKALGVPDGPAATLTQPWAVMVAVSRPMKGNAVAVGTDYYAVRAG